MKKRRRNRISVWVDTEVDVDVDEIIEEISDDLLVQECINRGLFNQSQADPISDTKRHLCDIAEVGYHTDNEELINLIKEKL